MISTKSSILQNTNQSIVHDKQQILSVCIDSIAENASISIVGSIRLGRTIETGHPVASLKRKCSARDFRVSVCVTVRSDLLWRTETIVGKKMTRSRRVKPFVASSSDKLRGGFFLNRGSIRDISLTIFAQVRW